MEIKGFNSERVSIEAVEVNIAHAGSGPLLVLWGSRSFVARSYDVLAVWRQYATQVEGRAVDCGHFLLEERPDDVIAELKQFFAQA
jgi:haloacetate dehalogenase